MTLRSHDRLTAAAVAVALVGFVWAYQSYTYGVAAERTRRHARLLEMPLWNLNQRTSLESIRVMSHTGGYRSMTLIHADGEPFVTYSIDADGGVLKRLLGALRLRRDHLIGQPIEHDGRAIGRLETVWMEDNTLVYMVALVVLAMAGGIAHYYYRLAHTRQKLEESNAELEHQMARRQALEDQLLQAQKMEAVGQLTAGIAHNFNNMLAGVLGNIELSLSEVGPEVKSRLEAAMQSGSRAADMVSQLNYFSRRTGANSFGPVDVGGPIGDTVSMCRNTFDRHIQIHVDLPSAIPPVRGDAGQLQQIIFNLLLNARDAVEGTGRSPSIAVKATVEDLDQEAAGAVLEAGEGSYVCIRVTDNGHGMDSQTLERIFEPFYTTKDVGKGTGLGLSTAYGIAHAHNGWIECESQVDSGTTVSVYVPATDAPEEAPPLGVSSPTEGGGETVLVVDDEDSVLRIVKELLVRSGFQVLTAVDGVEALAVYRENRAAIDLALIDLSMPRMPGEELISQLRAMDRNVKLVCLTGKVDLEPDEIGPVDGTIKKPMTRDELVGVVRQVLDS